MNKMEKVNIYHIEIILKHTDHSKLTTKDSNANKKNEPRWWIVSVQKRKLIN